MTTEPLSPPGYDIDEPDVSQIVTEDDTPVDNMYSEKQQRLLTEPLYNGWSGPPPREDSAPRVFLAAANVGVFYALREPPLVPDVFVALDVSPHPDLWEKKHRSYFVWEFGKTPDVVVEVVSNLEGGEFGAKKRRYQAWHIPYYVVWDPQEMYGGPALQVFELRGDLYVRMTRAFFAPLGLGVAPWTGPYEDCVQTWLRWCDAEGVPVPTAGERATVAVAEAEAARVQAEAAEARAARLAAKLRALGLDDAD